MLGKKIVYDIKNLNKKNLDRENLEKNESDLTFFMIDEEETDNTIRMLKQNYVTNTYKDETILNLQAELNKSNKDEPIDIKIKSFEKYNEAIDLFNKNRFSEAIKIIREANEINPKDTDILNLKGLLSILNCNFKEALECFYTSMCYKNSELPREYVDILSSDEFNEFLARYNHCIRFINEELNQESIQILNNIIDENPEFIEPYVILTLLYRKLGNENKEKSYLRRLSRIDKTNAILEDNKNLENDELLDNNSENLVNHNEDKVKDKNDNKNKDNKNLITYSAIGILASSMIFYHLHNKSEIDKLNEALKSQEEKIIQTENLKKEELNEELQKMEDELNKKEQELKNKENQIEEELRKKEEALKEKEQELKNDETEKNQEFDEIKTYENATNLRKVENYDEAIKYYKRVVENGKSKKYIAESIYQVAFLSEEKGNLEDAKKYYQKYINTYTDDDNFYDDSFYNLGMIYFEEGNVEKAKDIFYGLRYELPNSPFNNSKVKEVLSN